MAGHISPGQEQVPILLVPSGVGVMCIVYIF